MKPRLLTVDQAAIDLARSKDAVQHMVASRKLPVVRDGRRVFIDSEDLERWIDANKESARDRLEPENRLLTVQYVVKAEVRIHIPAREHLLDQVLQERAPQYESSESCKYSDAQSLLEQRRAEIFNGTHFDSKARRISVGDLLDNVERHYKINGQDHEWAERVLRKHLRPVFGLCLAAKVRYETVERYIEQRQAEGAANATINRELSLLHRAFTLGKEAGRLTVVPTLPKKLKENNVRKGFCGRDQFVAVRSALPPDIKPVVTFAYWTGCRKGEILSLVWRQVDWAERVVRLEPGETKNDDSERLGNKHARWPTHEVAPVQAGKILLLSKSPAMVDWQAPARRSCGL